MSNLSLINKTYPFSRLMVFNSVLATLIFLFIALGTINEMIQVDMPVEQIFYVSLLVLALLSVSFAAAQQFYYGFYCVYKIELTDRGVKWKNFISSWSMFYGYAEIRKIQTYNLWLDVFVSLRSQLSSHKTNYLIEMKDGKKYYLSGNIKGIDALLDAITDHFDDDL